MTNADRILSQMLGAAVADKLNEKSDLWAFLIDEAEKELGITHVQV